MKEMIILDTTLIALNERTADGWVLGTKAAKRLVKDFNEHLEERSAVQLDSSDLSWDIQLENVCGKIRKPGLQIKDGKVVAEIELLADTPKGKLVKEITEAKLPIYGDVVIEVMSKGQEKPKGNDYRAFHFCVLTCNPGVTSKRRCPVKRYDIPVIDGAELTKKENMIQKVKFYPVGTIVKVVGNVPTKGKVGQVDCVTGAGFGTYSYEIIDENGTNLFVVGTENLEKYEGYFERKDKYGDNPLAEPEKLDVVGTITRKVNEARTKL